MNFACEDYKPKGDAAGTLVCLPGVNSSAYLLQGAVEVLPKWRIIRVFPPGIEGAVMPFPFNVEAYAKQVWALLDAMKVEGPIVLLGHSMGGYAAQEVARMRPKKIVRMVLVSTSRGQPDTGMDMAAFPRKAGMSFWELNMLTSKDAAAGMAKLFGPGFAEREPIVFNAFITQRWQHLPDKTVTLSQLAAGAGFSSIPWIYNVKIPTLVVHGSEDVLVSAKAGKKLARSLPEGKWLEYYGVGHFPMLEHPRFWRDVAEFVQTGQGVGEEVAESESFLTRIWERWHVRG